MHRLQDKVAIITGAARGQGAAEARLFVAEGARVLIADILHDEGTQLAAELGDRAAYFRLDVTEADSWATAVESVADSWGGCDVLVNNAGLPGTGGIESTTPEQYDRLVAVNQKGVWNGMRAVLGTMRSRGGGSIVNISSGMGLFGSQGYGVYSSTKFAVRGLTRSAALEFADDGIRVNSVHPGFVDTAILGGMGADIRGLLATQKNVGGLTVPLGRMGEPEEIADLVLYLVSDESRYCTGSEFVIDGGMAAGPMTPVATGQGASTPEEA
jgi:3alpha(or 20beta)-hydroxysteroid dehydrogenase